VETVNDAERDVHSCSFLLLLPNLSYHFKWPEKDAKGENNSLRKNAKPKPGYRKRCYPEEQKRRQA
jgi:hypothetical protein